MKNSVAGYVPRVQKSPGRLLMSDTNYKQNKEDFAIVTTKKIKQRSNSFAHRIQEHAKLGHKITDAVKEKLSLGAKFLQIGGLTKVFKQNFGLVEREKLLKVFQCYLSTTAGPIAGLLFISSDKIAFCSNKSIKISSQTGDLVKIQYKVVIPLTRIKRMSKSTNVHNPSKKYLEIMTIDDFDFWFMGFLNYQKTFRYIQQAFHKFINDGNLELASLKNKYKGESSSCFSIPSM